MEIEKIGLDVPVQDVYPSYIDRYFTPRYSIDTRSKIGEDICVLFHSNRVCVIVLAPSHPVLLQKKTITQVNFETGDFNRMNNKLTGKRKRGGQLLDKVSPLCELKCDDGSLYTVTSSIPGKLIEINKRLLDNPSLITDKPSSEGYIGIVLPKTRDHDRLRDILLTPEKYQEAVAKRSVTNDTNCTSETSEVKNE